MPTSKAVREGGRRRVLTVLALAAAVAGVAALAVGLSAQRQPPQVSSQARGSIDPSSTLSAPQTTSGTSTDGVGAEQRAKRPLPPSRPASIAIAAIGVRSAVIEIGKDADGGLDVPKGKDIDKVAWYTKSPTPGQIGPSVIEGHIDTVAGPSVFYRLAALKPGNKINVTREDRTRVVFAVTAVRAYRSKDAFPTEVVYGGDLSRPSLRLITCSNFNRSTGHYAGNTVVFAQLAGVRHDGRTR